MHYAQARIAAPGSAALDYPIVTCSVLVQILQFI